MRELIAQIIADENDLNILLRGSGEFYAENGVYKVWWGDENWQFTIYSDGVFVYEGTPNVTGNCLPPHNLRWVRKLVNKGHPVEFAKMYVLEWKSLKVKKSK